MNWKCKNLECLDLLTLLLHFPFFSIYKPLLHVTDFCLLSLVVCVCFSFLPPSSLSFPNGIVGNWNFS